MHKLKEVLRPLFALEWGDREALDTTKLAGFKLHQRMRDPHKGFDLVSASDFASVSSPSGGRGRDNPSLAGVLACAMLSLLARPADIDAPWVCVLLSHAALQSQAPSPG